jgi:NAD(P)-dependent dehydrogenase (short-subunit alcohol dehydrogenase family)
MIAPSIETMLSNTKCLVTGASSGIGLGICQVLTKHGARVIGTGRNSAALLQLKSDGHILDFVVADISATESVDGKEISKTKSVVDEAAKIMGGLTAVVNAAGVLRPGAADAVTVENYDYNMNTNTRAAFEIMTHAIPYLKEAAAKDTAPSIINISSVNGKQSFPGCISYCMSKAAVDMMTRCASVDLAKYGIRVNSVNPGMVVTNIQKVRVFENEHSYVLRLATD